MEDWKRIQVGNFIIEKIDMDETDFIEVRTVGGEWRIMYRADSSMYVMISLIDPKDREIRESLKVVFTNMLAASTIIDRDYQHNLIEALSELSMRTRDDKEISDEEHEKIIREMKAAYEMRKEMKKTW